MPADHPLAQRRPTILAGTAEEDHEHDGRTRWEDVVNADLQELNIPRTEAETLAPDSRVSRRHIVSSAVATLLIGTGVKQVSFDLTMAFKILHRYVDLDASIFFSFCCDSRTHSHQFPYTFC